MKIIINLGEDIKLDMASTFVIKLKEQWGKDLHIDIKSTFEKFLRMMLFFEYTQLYFVHLEYTYLVNYIICYGLIWLNEIQ